VAGAAAVDSGCLEGVLGTTEGIAAIVVVVAGACAVDST
jgi:hypothetical protein